MPLSTADRIKRLLAVAGEFSFGLAIAAGGVFFGWYAWNHPEFSTSGSVIPPLMVAALILVSGTVVMSSALGAPRVLATALTLVFWMFLAFGNYFTFTSPHIQCSQDIALFGVPLVSSTYGGQACRTAASIVILSVDAFVLGGIGWMWWKSRRGAP